MFTHYSNDSEQAEGTVDGAIPWMSSFGRGKGKGGKGEREILEKPVSHILVDSRKELHGWWPGKRECTSERMLINPYNGCGIDCFYCYSRAFPGYFQLFRRHGVITVFRDFHRVIARQLDSISVATCGYLSPVTDPFQPVNRRYGLSEKIIQEFICRNLPIEFITKARIPDGVVELIRHQRHSFGQVSILTVDEALRRRLMRGGAPTEELFENLRRLATAGVHAVCRLDPVIPYLTDGLKQLFELVLRARDSGAAHLVASVMDIPLGTAKEVFHHLEGFGTGLARDLRRLYAERIGNALHAKISYRRGIFEELRSICDRVGLTFALCMEYQIEGGRPVGLNREFKNVANCEGIDIPVYIRRGGRFVPAVDCQGACLVCRQALCGVEDLAMGSKTGKRKSFALRDYRRWSRELESTRLH